MITLREVGAWEDRLLGELGRITGTLEQRDEQLTRTGHYAEYAALFSSYVDLAARGPDREVRLEALKRAAFLTWYEGAEPAQLTGLAELPALAMRRVMALLEELCRRDALDAELGWMLPWYHFVAEFALLRQPGLRCLEEFVRGADPHGWERVPLDPASLASRGQMGRYWLSLRRAA